MEKKQPLVFKRTGRAPILYPEAELLAEQDGQVHQGKDQNRWHTLQIWQVADGLVATITYHTQWEGEEGWLEAEIVEPDLEHLEEYFVSYDPTGPVRGFPPGQQYAEKQARLLDHVVRRYQYQVGELLADPAVLEACAR